MNETEVLLRTHRFLESQPLGQQSVLRLFTDAYSTLLPHKALAPFQRFTLDMGDFVMHPDLVGQLADGETIFAIEAKGDTDLLKGLAQAEMYQSGFHYAFLAADAGALGTSLVEFARRKDIGVIAVSDDVAMPYFPVARMPLRVPFQSILRQIATVIQVSQGETFHFNIPTHYLVWAIALAPNVAYPLDTALAELKDYPMPAEWRQALSGAQKLGLVRLLGNSVQLTPVGSTIKAILPSSMEAWTQVHKQVGTRGHSVPLVQCQPQAAAVLRLLLLQDDLVQLVIEGLQSFPDRKASFSTLAIACYQLDRTRTPIFFLKPSAVALLEDAKGNIDWELAEGEHYRSRTFYQYKSILKHAGILKPTRLGGATAKRYDPSRDMWALA